MESKYKIKYYESPVRGKMYSVVYEIETGKVSCNCEGYRFGKSKLLKVGEEIFPCEHIKHFYINKEYENFDKEEKVEIKPEQREELKEELKEEPNIMKIKQDFLKDVSELKKELNDIRDKLRKNNIIL